MMVDKLFIISHPQGDILYLWWDLLTYQQFFYVGVEILYAVMNTSIMTQCQIKH